MALVRRPHEGSFRAGLSRWIAAGIMGICAAAPATLLVAMPSAQRVSVVSLDESRCGLRCIPHRITIDSRGGVVIHFVRRLMGAGSIVYRAETSAWTVPVDRVAALLRRIDASPFFGLQEADTAGVPTCVPYRSHQPMAAVTVAEPTRRHRVVEDLGCGSQGPALAPLAAAIDSVGEASRVLGPAARPRQ